MGKMRIVLPDGYKLRIREFVEWEYNSGKENYERHTDAGASSWDSLPIEEKLKYIANSLLFEVLTISHNVERLGVSDNNSTHYFYYEEEGNNVKTLQGIYAVANVIYTNTVNMCKEKSTLPYDNNILSVRLDYIAQYIEENFEACLAMFANVPHMQWA